MRNLKFLHFPVAVKAVLLIAALGFLSIAANWFCLERLDELDRLNATVTRHVAPARLALAEAKAAIESFGVAVYKGYSASDPDLARESAEEVRRVSMSGTTAGCSRTVAQRTLAMPRVSASLSPVGRGTATRADTASTTSSSNASRPAT